MLSLLGWFGALPPSTCETSIKVYSKLGGIFLGAIQRPCSKNVDAYSVLRKLQDQVATWLCHPKMPPCYLALFVGTSRLTSPDMPFIDHLDAKSSQQILYELGETLRIDAMWDEDLTRAKSRLASKGLRVSVEGHKLSILHKVQGIDVKELLPMEVEAYTFRDTIRGVWTNFNAQRLGCIHLFPNLEELECKEVDFKRLAKIKTLLRLHISTEFLNRDVGLMTSVQRLNVQVNFGSIPDSIGLLTGLTELTLRGFHGNIPSRLGDLVELKRLVIQNTKLSGSIPSDLCRLTKLSSLVLDNNPQLKGSLPEEFNTLSLLGVLCLEGTPVNTKRLLDGWQKCSLGFYYSPLWWHQNS